MTKQEYQLKKMTLAVRAMFGFAAIVAAFAFLIQSTNPATADAAPDKITEVGRYGMQFQAEYDGVRIQWYTLVWDTSTGRSKMYYGNGKMGEIKAASGPFNLPSNPL